MKLAHYDDGKLKYQSHEIFLKENDFYHANPEVFSHDLFDIRGYGETEEEALSDFYRKIDYLFREYKALEKMLFETNILTDEMVEVDCFGNELN